MLGFGTTTLREFVKIPFTVLVEESATLLKPVANASNGSLVVLDVAAPVNVPAMSEFNDSYLDKNVKALVRRVKAIRMVLPNVSVGFYMQPIPSSEATRTVYKAMGDLGMWEAVDFLVPVLSIPAGKNATTTAEFQLQRVAAMSSGHPMAPMISWVYIGGNATPTAVSRTDVAEVVAVIDDLSGTLKAPVEMVAVFSDSDNAQACAPPATAPCTPTLSFAQWVQQTQIAPSRCLHDTTGE